MMFERIETKAGSRTYGSVGMYPYLFFFSKSNQVFLSPTLSLQTRELAFKLQCETQPSVSIFKLTASAPCQMLLTAFKYNLESTCYVFHFTESGS